jgi:hypothetical protein
MTIRIEAARPAPFLSVVIPCLNEANSVGDCVRQALAAIERLTMPGEVVVADNGSTDGSPEIAAAAGARVVHCSRRGYGHAICAGVNAARGEWLAMGDADGSYKFDEVDRFVPLLRDGADLVMGNRFRGGIEQGAMPWKSRYLGTPVLTWILNRLFQTRIGDSQCGLRAFARAAFDKMRLHGGGMELASEMLVKAARLGLRIEEVPVSLLRDKRNRRPHLRPWRDGWRHLKLLLMYSPLALFFAPGMFLAVLGAVLVAGLAAGPVRIGPVRFDVHWLVVGLLSLLVGVQVIQFGVAARLYAVRRLLPEHDRLLEWLRRRARVEHGLTLGGLMLLAGLAIDLAILWEWVANNFGELSRVRLALLATALMAAGVQWIAFSFLMAILADEPRDPPGDEG